jgi:hypothetical protein
MEVYTIAEKVCHYMLTANCEGNGKKLECYGCNYNVQENITNKPC